MYSDVRRVKNLPDHTISGQQLDFLATGQKLKRYACYFIPTKIQRKTSKSVCWNRVYIKIFKTDILILNIFM